MKLSGAHAQAFLDALWPCGDMAHLATYTRSFLAGSIGSVPKSLVGKYSPEDEKAASAALVAHLRDLADALERGLDDDNRPF